MENPFEEIKEYFLQLTSEIRELRQQVRELQLKENPTQYVGVQGLIDYIRQQTGRTYSPDTVYGWTHRNEIPYIKRGKDLLFECRLIDNWLRNDSHQSIDQIISGADEQLIKANRRRKRKC